MRFALALLCCIASTVQAETATDYTKPKLSLWSVFSEIPDTTLNTLEYSFTTDRIPAWALIVSSTAVLFHYDDDIYAGAKADGRRWNLGNDDHTRTVYSAFGQDILRLPSDTGSALYFLGDGWTHMSIAAGFFLTGYFGDAVRPYNTGLELVHGMIVSTIFDQVIKRSTGRESPNHSTESRGKFRPFPSLPGYQGATPVYDAFPSGHIMTATLTFTTIESNYPEYRWYIWPVEGVWLTALGFEMVNNGVHWASDYPLGIALGYVIAKMSVHMNEKSYDISHTGRPSAWAFYPSVGPDGPTVNAVYQF
jgi:hypothetical protein